MSQKERKERKKFPSQTAVVGQCPLFLFGDLRTVVRECIQAFARRACSAVRGFGDAIGGGGKRASMRGCHWLESPRSTCSRFMLVGWRTAPPLGTLSIKKQISIAHEPGGVEPAGARGGRGQQLGWAEGEHWHPVTLFRWRGQASGPGGLKRCSVAVRRSRPGAPPPWG